jgi:hypothetical protein
MKKYKIILMTLLVLTFSGSLSSAAFDIPKYVYRIDQLQQAEDKAKADKKQIVFLFSEERTNCLPSSKASISIMQRFKNKSVIVYFGKENWAKAPQIVREAINSPAAGSIVPIAVVVDTSIKKVVSIIPYQQGNSSDRYPQADFYLHPSKRNNP